jgi:hypothetical protein
MDAKWWWLLGMLGPLGLLAAIRAALTSYADWRASRGPKLSYASCEQVAALEETFRDFIPKVFGFGFDECFISDESSLTDFTDDPEALREIHARIRALYDVDVAALPDDLLVTIVRWIAEKR